MTKAEWRKHFLNLRKSLSVAEIELLSKKIGQHLLSLLTATDTHVHVFLPIEKFNEINTWIIIDLVAEHRLKVKWLVAKTDFKAGTMQHFHFEKNTTIAVNNYGIPEPKDAVKANINNITTVLVPMLGVDKLGNRLGYGKGFYDRFLAQCPPTTKTIGLSIFEPVDELFETDNWDIPLQYAVSPTQVYTFIA